MHVHIFIFCLVFAGCECVLACHRPICRTSTLDYFPDCCFPGFILSLSTLASQALDVSRTCFFLLTYILCIFFGIQMAYYVHVCFTTSLVPFFMLSGCWLVWWPGGSPSYAWYGYHLDSRWMGSPRLWHYCTCRRWRGVWHPLLAFSTLMARATDMDDHTSCWWGFFFHRLR